MDKISVIIPIYNVEKYLGKCIESILQQTYTKLEIILVNDGSKDGSLALCQEYAKKDDRIIVIDKANEGVSIARNTGLEQATGTYVAFVDPDDWIEPGMYESMLTQIKKYEAPVCLCNFYKDTKRRSQPKYFEFDDELLVGSQVVEGLVDNMIGVPDLLPKYVYVMGCVWRGLYQKAFIEANQLRFVPKLTVMEDLIFIVQALLKCDRVAIDQGVWYHYVQHATSALHTYNEKMWEDQLMVYHTLEKSIRDAGLEEAMRNRLDYRYIGMIFSAIKNETFIKKDGDFKETILRMMDIFTDDNLKVVLERVKPIQLEKNNTQEESKARKAAIRAKRYKAERAKKEQAQKQAKKEAIKKAGLQRAEKSKAKKSRARKNEGAEGRITRRLGKKPEKTSLYKKTNDEYNE